MCHCFVSALCTIILLQFFLQQPAYATNADDDDQFLETAKKPLKVLVYSPTNYWSHMYFLGAIADTLVDAGHEVHFVKLLIDPRTGAVNETKKARIHRVKLVHVSAEKLDSSKQLDSLKEPFSGTHFRPYFLGNGDKFTREFCSMLTRACQEIVQNTELQRHLANEHFDVAIGEMFDPCPFAFFKRIGVRTRLGALAIPLIQPMARNFGIPKFSSFVPNSNAPSSEIGPAGMPFWARAVNFYNDFYEWAVLNRLVFDSQSPLIEVAFGADFLPADRHTRNVSLLFVNANPFLDFPRPISSKIVYVGGLLEQQRKAKEEQLDQKVQKALDDPGKRGAVLVSFGTLSDGGKMSAKMRGAMLAAFAHFPEYIFLWKISGISSSRGGALPTNVHLFDWLQQTAILKHPRLRGFISHCGQNSLNEAARAGVPLVAIPLFADQLYNAALAKHKGMAVYVDVRQLHEDGDETQLVDALDKILHDPSYRTNAQLIGKKMQTTPFSPREQLVKWVEFAAQFPELNELNMPDDEQLGLLAYYSVDVILVTLLVLALISLSIGLLLARVWRIFLHSGRSLISNNFYSSKHFLKNLKQE